MVMQEFGHALRIVNVPLHAQAERFQPLEEEERVEGREAAANIAQDLHASFEDEGQARPGSAVDQPVIAVIGLVEVGEARVVGPLEVAAVDDHAADGGAVPADELGGRMDHDIRAPLKRAAQVGRGEGIVDHQRDAGFLGDFCDLFEREDVDPRVAQRLAVQDLGVGPDGAAEIFRVARVDKGHIDAQPREGIGKLVVGAAVQGRGGDNMVARAAQGEDGLGLGGVPRS